MRLFVLARPSAIAIIAGARKTPPPTPVRPEISPTMPPTLATPQKDALRSGEAAPISPQDHHGACDQQNHSHHRFVDAFVEHDDPAEQRGRHRRREQYPQLLPIDGFVAIERPGRIRRGDDVERQRRWTHLRCRKGGESHQGQECGPAGLAHRRIQQRDEAKQQSEQGGDPKSMS